jgi:pyridoxine/pyridoxamine 5'-phosphate oxidase
MEILHFEDIQAEFMARAQQAVCCNVATVDPKGRPRSRVMHVVWDGSIGWVITSPNSHKARHLANNPYVSLAYISNPMLRTLQIWREFRLTFSFPIFILKKQSSIYIEQKNRKGIHYEQ